LTVVLGTFISCPLETGEHGRRLSYSNAEAERGRVCARAFIRQELLNSFKR
jgi:hypothetical protein